MRTCPAILRTPPRRIAYTLRIFAAPLWKFLGLHNPDADPALSHRGLDVSLLPQPAKPTLKRPPVESGFLLDLPVTHRRAPQDEANFPRLMRLPQHQPAVEPERRAHTRVVALLE